MPSSSRLALAVRHRDLPLRRTGRTCSGLELARRVRQRPRVRARVGPATVYLSDDDYEIDWASLAFVAVDEAYAGDYRGRVGRRSRRAQGLLRRIRALVTAHAASSRTSRRSTNVALPRGRGRAAPGSRERGRRQSRASAPRRGEAALHVMGASWGHALHPPEAFGRARGRHRARAGRRARRRPRAMRPSSAHGARAIVKVNIEGEECPTILGTPASAWADVDELYVETHPWARAGRDELALHLAGGRSQPR